MARSIKSIFVKIDPDTFSTFRKRANVLGMGVKDFIWCSLAYELKFYSEAEFRFRKSISDKMLNQIDQSEEESLKFEIGPDLLPKLREVAAMNGFSVKEYVLMTLDYEIGFWAELGYGKEFGKAISDAYDQGLFDEE